MIYQIGVGFQGTKRPLSAQKISARGLHGVLYHILKQYDERGSTRLHNHPAPKPYTLAPYYDTEDGTLAGIRLNALTEETAVFLHRAFQTACSTETVYRLGSQRFRVADVVSIPITNFEQLASSPPENQVTLRFLSPTTFRQGSGYRPLPFPVNVFNGPLRTWNAFAPAELLLPSDWRDWCEEKVFVERHQIETVSVMLNKYQPEFIGFIGDVQFYARSDALLYLSLWQGLASLAAFSGTGYKTTMGMGAIERLA